MSATPATIVPRCSAGFRGIGGGPDAHPTPVVFLHGAWSTHRCFAGFIEFFGRRGWSALAFSRRGRFDLGPANALGVSMEDYLDDTRAVLGAIGGRPILVGHSLGGLIAQVMAAESRCVAAVLIEPCPPKQVPIAWRVWPWVAPLIDTGHPFRPSRAEARRAFLNRVAPERLDSIYDRFVPESGRAFREMLLGYDVAVDRVTCPLLLVSGLDSPSLAPWIVRSTARLYRDAELLELPGHSHWMIEEPGWVNVASRLESWITRKVGGSPAIR